MLHRCFNVAVGALVVVLAMSATVLAVEGDVPEVDPASMSGAVALLAAGGLFVADRIRRKFIGR